MTNQEAINVMQKYVNSDTISPVVQEAHNKAINALEKQVPKRPVDTVDKAMAICPKCGLVVRVGNQTKCMYYCHYCGQRLDWEEDDDAQD